MKTEEKLAQQVESLSQAIEKIYRTQGYSRESEKLMLLREIVKEQVGESISDRKEKYEITHPSARLTR